MNSERELEKYSKAKKRNLKPFVKLFLTLLMYILQPLIKRNHLKYTVQWVLIIIYTHVTTTTHKKIRIFQKPLQITSCPFLIYLTNPPSTFLLTPAPSNSTLLFSHYNLVLLILELLMIRIKQYVLYCVQLYWLSITFLGFIHSVLCIHIYFFIAQ